MAEIGQLVRCYNSSGGIVTGLLVARNRIRVATGYLVKVNSIESVVSTKPIPAGTRVRIVDNGFYSIYGYLGRTGVVIKSYNAICKVKLDSGSVIKTCSISLTTVLQTRMKPTVTPCQCPSCVAKRERDAAVNASKPQPTITTFKEYYPMASQPNTPIELEALNQGKSDALSKLSKERAGVYEQDTRNYIQLMNSILSQSKSAKAFVQTLKLTPQDQLAILGSENIDALKSLVL